jgi:hypothetical protein
MTMAGLSAVTMFPDLHDESASSIVYEPLSTLQQDKENCVNHPGPLSTRHASSSSDHYAPSGRRWVDGMVKVAHACNLLVLKNCHLCHVYADRQVEFEQGQETRTPSSTFWDATASSSPAERAWKKLHASLEVDLYRQFLFDEDSVMAVDPSPLPTRVDPDTEEDKHDEPTENLTSATPTTTNSEFVL